jgi:BirA family biotin operon repressor/biotin-[acetyl-CoA-carboxylase] ligase
MWFDRARFEAAWFQLAGETEPPRLQAVEQVDSTNRLAWELAGLGVPWGAIAQSQTAGRGQWGRVWQSPVGGLYLSWAIAIASVPPLLVTLLSAWGIAQQLRDRGVPVWLKWPNDLILRGRKLGGIKTEVRGAIAVVGVGLNWCNPVPDTGIALAADPDSGVTSLEELAAIAIAGIQQGNHWGQSRPMSAVLADYWELLETKHRSVSVAGAPGQVIGITPTGELQVRLQGGQAHTELNCPPGAVQIGYPDPEASPRSELP